MEDTQKAAPVAEDQGQNAGDETKESNNQQASDQTSSSTNSEEAGKASSEAEKKDATPPATETEEVKEPPVRKTKLDYIRERQQKKAEKEAKKDIEPSPEENNSFTEDELTPEEEAKLDRHIEKKFGQKLNLVDQLASEGEVAHIKEQVDEFLKTHKYGEHFKPYADKILTWAKHPSRANIPVATIAYEIAGEKLMEIGAQAARAADKAQRETETAGNGNRSTSSTTKKYSEMSTEEFLLHQASVLNKAR